jgi:uncharacterized radical SAM superfamily Fe-S cluster-containing enzyme
MKYDLSLEQFDLGSINDGKIFVLGIGGGNDAVGAYAVARLIKRAHPNSEILYGSCLSSDKKNYIGFVKICEGLYIRDLNEEFNESPTLRLVQRLKIFDKDFCTPYVLISDSKRETGRISNEALDYFKEYTIITIDNGGDSLTGGKEDDDKGFDYKNVMYLKEKGLSFLHIILSLGCDGESNIEKIKEMINYQSQSIIGEFAMDEIALLISPMIGDISSPERKNVDTTVIILEAACFLKNNKNTDELYTVPRHERSTQVPYVWLNKAIVFCGQKLCEVTKYRHIEALMILQKYQTGNYRYLGKGSEGVVFTDGIKVFKIYNSILPKVKQVYLEMSRSLLHNAIHLYEIDDIIMFQGRTILIYPYEISEPIASLSEDDFVSFLAEMWQKRLIFSSMKPRNFIRVKSVIKLIDFEFKPYTDDLFLNMCVRAFIHLKYYGEDTVFIKKLLVSAKNNMYLQELNGIQDFVNKVFSTVIFRESQTAIQSFLYKPGNDGENIIEIPFYQLKNLDTLFYDSLTKGLYLKGMEIKDIKLNKENYFEPAFAKLHYHKIKPFRETVSLIIKTCSQDCETIYASVKHIVKQLSTPDTFYEKIIAVDGKVNDFTREYTNKWTLEELILQINRLIEEQVVDRYIMLLPEEVADINNRWFGIKSNATHCTKEEYAFQVDSGVPVTPQLYAFEQAKGEYIFQMDSDVMIARKDLSHSYLEDMVLEMEKNEKVVSVGFNICQSFSLDYKPYFGFKNGGFIPEVRMGLFHKKRFLSLRPLPNSLDKTGNWKLSWYRAMEQKQKETDYCSIRGGDSRSFYIHPHNYRKSNADVWTTILDRTESGYIPDCQQNEFDCAGSYYDWTIPKRNEKLVVLCYLRNIEYARFLKMFCSLLSQTYQDWGMIIIDDASDNGLPVFIDNIIKPYLSKITFVKNRVQQGLMANIYKAIHYFVSNRESIIVTVDGGNALIGNSTFSQIMWQYDFVSADVVIGKAYLNFCFRNHYSRHINFLHPRETNSGNTWQYIRSFKKYLFDSLEISDLKIINQNKNVVKKLLSYKWLPVCTDCAIMVPIFEISKNPQLIDLFAYYYEGQVKTPQIKELEEECITDILNKPVKNPSLVYKRRKTFLPNLNKIEIDITYDCNLKCIACNRSCSQAPTMEEMDFSDIKKFVSESIALKKKWDLINILGGEPTLHSGFEEIIKYILEKYILSYSPETVLQIVSNGLTVETRNVLNKVKQHPNVFIDKKSFKTNNKVEYFSPFNDAPIDDVNFINADYKKACWITSYCGIGLNKFGYYACTVCGGIDRIINENRGGIESLKDVSIENIQEQFLKFCRLCGNFKNYDVNHGDFIPRCEIAPFKDNIVSKTWGNLYYNYNEVKK